ncbi:class A beta-lactamase [Sphingomonas montanisoli]|nr:class A beta-lactamase [Sphingomonas montanisoli]
MATPLHAEARPAALTPKVREAIVQRLDARLEAFTQRKDAIRVGIAAVHLESGAALSVNGDEAFPMASAYKLAAVLTLLHQVEQGRFTMDQMIPVDDALRVQSGGISTSMPHPGIALSVANLIDLTITRSDNTAADMVTQMVGGPAAITAWLRSVGIEGQRVDRDVAGLIFDYKHLTPEAGRNQAQTLARVMSLRDDNPDEPNSTLDPAFIADPRDSSTPDAMVALLAKLQRGQLVDAEHTAWLLDVMAHTVTGAKRVKGLLPPRTVFAHKTGTLVGICADVGILTLPGGGHVAVAIFVKSHDDGAKAEAIIAEAGRTIYDGMALLD